MERSRTEHKTTIHAICPKGGWDYYKVRYIPDRFLSVEDFQVTCDQVRGMEIFQEGLISQLGHLLPPGFVSIVGMHGGNTRSKSVCDIS